MTVWRVHGVSVCVTLVTWAAIAVMMGWDAALVVAVLVLLEITFSFDNAVVNAQLVKRLSPFWEKLFMTAGIVVAVVVVRFVLPVLIVAATAGLSVGTVTGLVLYQPGEYARILSSDGTRMVIEAFGGMFLLMIAVSFFLDHSKDVHWFAALEKRLAPLGRYDNVGVLLMLAGTVAMFFTLDANPAVRIAVFVAAVCGIGLHIGLDVFSAMMDGHDGSGTVRNAARLTGSAAALMVVRLEVIDASFSFDGVIGAFAISSNVVLIAAGLGVGAVWVRSFTVQMVHHGTLEKYRYLTHGAHWAILALGAVMIAALFQVHLPEMVTGSIGLAFIAAAVWYSIGERRRDDTASRTLAPDKV